MAKAEKEESPLFVGITGGDELRRSVLECSKDILESLKDYESFKNVKEEKTRLIHQLRGDIKNISRLISRLKNQLPKVKDVGIKRSAAKKVKEEHKVVEVEKPKIRTEVEKLEGELKEIEEKLNGLS